MTVRSRQHSLRSWKANERRTPVTGPLVVMRKGRLVRQIVTNQTLAADPGAENTLVEPEFPPLTGFGATLIVTLVISLLLPVSYQVGPIRLTPYIGLIVLMFIPMLISWGAQKRTPIILPDLLVLLFCMWATIAVFLSQGLSGLLETAGVHWGQTFGAYLAGRLLIRDPRSLRLFVLTVVLAISFMLPFLIIEAITGAKLILRAAGMIGTPFSEVIMGKRMGLHRAQGAFEHPILMGVFCASIMSLGYYAFRDSRYRVMRWIAAPISAVSAIMSMSTGALLALNIQFGLMMWGRILKTTPNRWKILNGLLLSTYFVVDLFSTRTPFHVFVNYATFSASSSYNRILIWQFGTEEVARHPFFGIGLGNWTRPGYMSSSMDNFWLVQAVRYGLPALIMLGAAFIILLLRMGKEEGPTKELDQLRRGAIFSLVATMVAAFSVHLWNASYVWLMFFLGSVAWLALPGQSSPQTRTVRAFARLTK